MQPRGGGIIGHRHWLLALVERADGVARINVRAAHRVVQASQDGSACSALCPGAHLAGLDRSGTARLDSAGACSAGELNPATRSISGTAVNWYFTPPSMLLSRHRT